MEKCVNITGCELLIVAHLKQKNNIDMLLIRSGDKITGENPVRPIDLVKYNI
jgi:hypothetical protein